MTRLEWGRTAARYFLREFGRHRLFIALASFLPFVFVQTTFLVSPETQVPVRTEVAGFRVSRLYFMPHVHGTIMAPVTGAFVSGMTGILMARSGNATDERLVGSGFQPSEVVVARLLVVSAVALLVSSVSVAILLLNVPYENPSWVFLGVLLASGTYGFLGLGVGTFLDRTSGLYVALFAPMLDIGVFQDPIFFNGDPTWWMQLFPGHFAVQTLFNGGFTGPGDSLDELLVAAAYLLGFAIVAVVLYRRRIGLRDGEPDLT